MFNSRYFNSRFFNSNYFDGGGVGESVGYLEVHFNGQAGTLVALTRLATYNTTQDVADVGVEFRA